MFRRMAVMDHQVISPGHIAKKHVNDLNFADVLSGLCIMR